MSVLVKNMEFPKNCAECRFWSICECLKEFDDYESLLYAVDDGDLVRADNCPLVEVEPHGDLTDKDKLMQEIMDSDLDHLQRDDWKEVIQIVSDADVIIKAEGREE
jgi:hypothetical protein